LKPNDAVTAGWCVWVCHHELRDRLDMMLESFCKVTELTVSKWQTETRERFVRAQRLGTNLCDDALEKVDSLLGRVVGTNHQIFCALRR
jgi:hypothetical protein